MKSQITISSILVTALFFLNLLGGVAQETEKEKQVHIKTVKEVDGKKVVTDTTFTVKEGEDVQEMVKVITTISEGDSLKVTVDVDMDSGVQGTKQMVVVSSDVDEDAGVINSSATTYYFSDADSLTEINVQMLTGEGNEEGERKVLIIKKEGGGETVKEIMMPPRKGRRHVMKFKTDDGEKIIIISPDKPCDDHFVRVSGEDSADYFEFDKDFDFDYEEFEAEMEEQMEELENTHVIMLDELGELKELEELGNLDRRMIRPPHPPRHRAFPPTDRFDRLTDKELRDAGIKNKPDRLELDNINIDMNNGILNLTFALKGEGSPKVDVYNFFGDKVFSGKPELANGTYKSNIDLSTKQHGTYYLQITYKNSSFTEKFRL